MSQQDEIYRNVLKDISIEGLVEYNPYSDKKEWKGFTWPAYRFTNEWLEGLFSKINYKNKNILSIVGSGDHIFSSIMNNATSVTCFDQSIYACFFAELKYSGIVNLEYEEFNGFFGEPLKNNEYGHMMIGDSDFIDTNTFDIGTYEKIKDELSNITKEFFDEIIKKKLNYEGVEIPYAYAYMTGTDSGFTKKYTPYLKSKENFNRTKDCLSDRILFYPMHFWEFIRQTERNFDLIYLSNIQTSSNYNVIEESLKHLDKRGKVIFFDYCVDEVKEHLGKVKPITKVPKRMKHDFYVKSIKLTDAYAI